MWQQIGKVILGPVLLAMGHYVYGRLSKKKAAQSSTEEPPVILGKFAIWGRPNAGKTTFIRRLMKQEITPGTKEATTAIRKHTDVPLFEAFGHKYRITEIDDMPGNNDRRNDWLNLVKSHDHVFYMINLKQVSNDADYKAAVRGDLKATIRALEESEKPVKRLNIIASHIDETYLKDIDPSEVNNTLQREEDFCLLYESINDFAGYVYPVNLTDENSFNRLLESITSDCA